MASRFQRLPDLLCGLASDVLPVDADYVAPFSSIGRFLELNPPRNSYQVRMR